MTALARISRISFLTDMTRAGAPIIPLGYMVEAVWPDQARWLGLIGRTRLTPLEFDLINLATWPDLRNPYHLLTSMFEQGWKAGWGNAGAAVQSSWSRSALDIDVSDKPEMFADTQVDTEAAWVSASNFLNAELTNFQRLLVPAPAFAAPVIPLQRGTAVPAIGQQVKFGTPETAEPERPLAA